MSETDLGHVMDAVQTVNNDRLRISMEPTQVIIDSAALQTCRESAVAVDRNVIIFNSSLPYSKSFYRVIKRSCVDYASNGTNR